MYEDKFREFSALVARADKALLRAKAEYVRPFGLRGVHVSCLLALLNAGEGLTASELSARCEVDRAQISRVLSELTERGLVGGTDSDGRRRYRGSLCLTEEGRRTATAMIGIVDDKLEQVASGLDAKELETFYSVFRTIVERLEKI